MKPTATKQVVIIAQSSTTNAATAAGNVDTKGYDFASIDVLMATSNDTTNNPTVFKLAESDDTVTTNFSDITVFVGDDSDGWTIPAAETAATNAPNAFKFNVDLSGRKRYLRLSISPLTTQVITAIANLSKAEQSPVSSTDANVKALIEG